MHLKNRPRVGFFMPEFCRIQDLCSIVIIIRHSHLGNLSSGGHHSTPCLLFKDKDYFENKHLKSRPCVGFLCLEIPHLFSILLTMLFVNNYY